MGINISQFNPPGTVSNLVWDDDMEAGAGKIFKGDLTGDVIGDVTGDVSGDMVGNITNGGVNGYLLRSGVVSASSGTLVVPAGSSGNNTPVTIPLNGSGTYCVVGNTQKCFYPNPCLIPIVFGAPISGAEITPYAESYTSAGVLIERITAAGNLNIYGASYIILRGKEIDVDGIVYHQSCSVADAYIDADTTVIPGMINPPTTGVFTGDVVGNVTGNVTGDVTGNLTGDIITTYRMTPRTPYVYTVFQSGSASTNDNTSRNNMLYNVLPNQLLTGSINAYFAGNGVATLQFLDKGWSILSRVTLTRDGFDYTLPAGTNCIVLTLNSNYISGVAGHIARFDIAVV